MKSNFRNRLTAIGFIDLLSAVVWIPMIGLIPAAYLSLKGKANKKHIWNVVWYVWQLVTTAMIFTIIE